MMDVDRRTEPRNALLLRVDYPDLDGFIQDYTANISQGGTMICTRREVMEGQELEVAISFPGLLEPIHLFGTVRWVREDLNGERAFGIEFHQDDSSGWSRLGKLVARVVARDEMLIASRTLRVLVVENNLHIAHLICQGLETQLPRGTPGVAVFVEHSPDGVDAEARLEANEYDLLLLDVAVPLLDGVSLITKLRADNRWQQLPIVAFGRAAGDAPERALRAGADFFLGKPLRLPDLMFTIGQLALLDRSAF